MSIDSSTMNPNWAPPPPKPGMSGATKVLIGVGVGCGIMLFVCCGGFLGFGLYMQSWLKQAISEEPAAVGELAASMAKIDVPEGLKPALAFRVKTLPWGQDVGEAVPSFVVFSDPATESDLILVSALDGTSVHDRRQVRNQINAMLQKKKLADVEPVQAEKTYATEVEIGGEKATFSITEGKSPTTGKKRLQATGKFQGNSGPVVLFLSVDAEKYDAEAAIKMLKSIQTVANPSQPTKAKPATALPPAR